MNSNTTKTNSRLNIYLMTRIALVTALLCVLGPFAIPIPISPVPISLTNFVIFLSIFILEWKWATVSVCLYILIGFVGLPVFSGFSGGPGKLLGPTGGYIIGFIFLVLISGLFVKFGRDKHPYLFPIIGILLGEVVLYILGTAWISFSMEITFTQGLFMAVIPYLPGDAVKIILAVLIGQKLKSLSKRYAFFS